MANYTKRSSVNTNNSYKAYVPATTRQLQNADTSGYLSARNNYLADRYSSVATPGLVTYTKMNPIFNTGGKNYNTYRGSDGNYYYLANGKYVKVDGTVADTIAKNRNISFIDPNDQRTTSKTNTSTNTTKTSSGGSGGGGGYSGGGGSGKNTGDDYDKLLNEYKALIDELRNPKVWTADEVAKQLGVEDLYNYDRILRMYNDATDRYYTDAIAEQNAINRDAEMSNSSYANQMLKRYLSSYNNSAPTAVGRGTLAANALSTLLGADIANEEASSQLNDIINSYNEKWKYETENNKTLARDRYNDMGLMLLNQGTNINSAQVQDYINSLNAYNTAYAGIRNAQNNLASTAAATYQNNAQAALARNQVAAANTSGNLRKKIYDMYYGGLGDNASATAYDNTKRDESIVRSTATSAN